ncbi:MAG: MopE-related protein [Myxococcota bacterium]
MRIRTCVKCVFYTVFVILTGCFADDPASFLDGTPAISPSPTPTATPITESPTAPPDTPPPSVVPDSPTPPTDGDGDGSLDAQDCAPTDPSSYPGAVELCDGIDNDCDSIVDDGLPLFSYYIDEDGDGVGGSNTVAACLQPSGTATVTGDCTENDADIFPGAPELCDGIDNDCDGAADETFGLYCPDKDGDGFGEDGEACVENCGETSGTVRNNKDCLDSNPNVYPGAPELCDGVDQDCVDAPEVSNLYYSDLDGDGFGDDGASQVELCASHPQFSMVGLDCDDTTALLHPLLVDKNGGSAEGDGSILSPFNSIPLALQAGDDCGQILVMEADYSDPILIMARQLPLTIQPFEADGRIGQSTPGAQAIVIEDSQQLTLKGFDLSCTSQRTSDGGALWISESSDVRLEDISISSCTVKNANGGGMLVQLSSNVVVTRSQFSDNRAGVGGAIAIRGASVWVIDSSFYGNRAESAAGGAIEVRESSSKVPGQLYVEQSEFIDNSAKVYGGALSGENETILEVRDSYFAENQADEQYGGGINNPSLVLRSTFVSNLCPGGNNYADGAGVMLRRSARVANSIFMGNDAYYAGGVDIFEISDTTAHVVEHNTFVDNDSTAGLSLGDTFYIFAADKVTFQNNIVVDLDGGNGAAIYNLDTDVSWTIAYNFVFTSSGSAIGSGLNGVNASVMGQYGNMSEDIRSKPFFVSYEVGSYDTANLRLVSNASAVDAGDPNSAKDLDGTRADMGAYGGPDAAP